MSNIHCVYLLLNCCRLYARLIEGLNQLLSSSIHTFEEVETTISLTKLSDDFDTATEQMDGAKVCSHMSK